MTIIVVSPKTTSESEIETVNSLFKAGLDVFHLRKPGYSRRRLAKYIKAISPEYRNKIVIHSHHTLAIRFKLKGIHLTRMDRKKPFVSSLKIKYIRFFKSDITISATFHNLSHIYDNNNGYDYVFLSPIFDSISKSGYQSGFNFHSLKVALTKTEQKVIAIGGVELSKIDIINNMGFSGIALVGTIWQSKEPLEEFIAIKEKCKNSGITH